LTPLQITSEWDRPRQRAVRFRTAPRAKPDGWAGALLGSRDEPGAFEDKDASTVVRCAGGGNTLQPLAWR